MTNREYIIAQLSDKACIDDNGASYESMVCNSIACPYTNEEVIAWQPLPEPFKGD